MNVNDRPGPAMALPSWARVGGTKAGALGWSLRRTPPSSGHHPVTLSEHS